MPFLYFQSKINLISVWLMIAFLLSNIHLNADTLGIDNLNINAGTVAGGTEITVNGSGFARGIYQVPINITNNSGQNLNNYQVQIRLDTLSLINSSKMRNDCGDIRFLDNQQNNLNYWLESGCNTSQTKFVLKMPSINQGQTSIYAKYGDMSLASISDGNNVFDFFDDFDSGVVNTDSWELNTGSFFTVGISSGQMVVDANVGENDQYGSLGFFYKNWQFSSNYTIESDFSILSGARNGWKGMFGTWDNRMAINNGRVQYYDNGWQDLGASNLAGTQINREKVGITVLNGGNMGWYENDVLKAIRTGQSTGGWMPFNFGPNGVSSYKVGFDNIRVRKAVVNPPVATVGSPSPITNSSLVYFADGLASNIRVLSSSQIVLTTPAHTAGKVDVKVKNSDNQEVVLSQGFTYLASNSNLSSTDLTMLRLDIAPGELSIISPTNTGLSSVVSSRDTFVQGSLNNLGISDLRGSLAGWSATLQVTNFTGVMNDEAILPLCDNASDCANSGRLRIIPGQLQTCPNSVGDLAGNSDNTQAQSITSLSNLNSNGISNSFGLTSFSADSGAGRYCKNIELWYKVPPFVQAQEYIATVLISAS